MLKNMLITNNKEIFLQQQVQTRTQYRIMRIPLAITASEQIISLESFKKTFDFALALRFLNSSNEDVVVAFGK
jgi:hypothetical protein